MTVEMMVSPIAKGGWVSWSLLGLGALLWYVIGYRYWQLKYGAPSIWIDAIHNRWISELRTYKQVVRSIITVAPLLGLLGTVSGMIETFSSLGSQAMHSQAGGGIAGGISQALLTTQMGLMVAIPGLLVGRQLEKSETHMCENSQNAIPAGVHL